MENAIREFVESLDERDRMLIEVRDVLYEGRWSDMLADMTAARDGGPFVFKIAERVEEDLERARRMRNFEQTHDVQLNQLLGESSDDQSD